METIAALLIVLGAVVGSEAACNMASCPMPAGQTCSAYGTYVSCMTSQLSGCPGMQSAITAANSVMTSLGCSSGGGSGGTGGTGGTGGAGGSGGSGGSGGTGNSAPNVILASPLLVLAIVVFFFC